MTSALFDRGASRYDLLVGLNPGHQAELGRAGALAGRATNRSALRLIDLARGSGASTAALLDAVPKAKVLGLDASAGMLAQARAKDCRPILAAGPPCSIQRTIHLGYLVQILSSRPLNCLVRGMVVISEVPAWTHVEQGFET